MRLADVGSGLLRVFRNRATEREAGLALRASERRHRSRVELGDALRALNTPSEIMETVAERLGPHLGVDRANYYYLADGDRFAVTDEWRTEASPGMLGSHLVADFGKSTVALPAVHVGSCAGQI